MQGSKDLQTGSCGLLEVLLRHSLGETEENHSTHQSEESGAWPELKPGTCTRQDMNQSPSVGLPVTLWCAAAIYKSQHTPVTIRSARTRRWKQTQCTDSCSIHANESCEVQRGKSELPKVALVGSELAAQVRHVCQLQTTFSSATTFMLSLHTSSQRSPATETVNLISHFTSHLSRIESQDLETYLHLLKCAVKCCNSLSTPKHMYPAGKGKR
jgi:hypothetical protein